MNERVFTDERERTSFPVRIICLEASMMTERTQRKRRLAGASKNRQVRESRGKEVGLRAIGAASEEVRKKAEVQGCYHRSWAAAAAAFGACLCLLLAAWASLLGPAPLCLCHGNQPTTARLFATRDPLILVSCCVHVTAHNTRTARCDFVFVYCTYFALVLALALVQYCTICTP